MTKWKKTAAALCAFAIFFGGAMLPQGSLPVDMPFVTKASAETFQYTEKGINYNINMDNKTAEVAKTFSVSGDVEIPQTLEDYGPMITVTAIGDDAFSYNYGLTSITFPDSVTSIGDRAFSSCSALTSITLPDSVTSIGDYAFYYCYNLESINIPSGVTAIGDHAFGICSSLESITIPASVTSIGEDAFGACSSLKSITIPDSVTSIGNYAFSGCSALADIYIPDSLSVPDAAIPVTANKITYTTNSDDGITVTGITPGIRVTTVTIPDTIAGKSVSAICVPSGLTVSANEAASKITYTTNSTGGITVTGITPGTNVTTVTIPNNIAGTPVSAICVPSSGPTVNVNEAASKITYTENDDSTITITKVEPGTNATNIEIPETIDGKTVTVIGDEAFSGCSSLKSITLPGSVTSIGASAFQDCANLADIYLPDGLNVPDTAIPATTNKITYVVNEDTTTATITKIEPKTDANTVDIPASIGKYEVIAVAKACQSKVGDHTHKGGTATCTAQATCDLCGQGYGETTPHTLTEHSAQAATCTTAGKAAYYTCGNCNKHFEDETGSKAITNLDSYGVINPIGHSWNEPAWSWADDGKSATATFTCANAQHPETVNAIITSKETTAATCTESGTTTYTASVNFNGADYSATKDVADIAPTGHTAGDTWQHESSTHWQNCTSCNTKLNEAAHVYDDGQDATCNVCGYERATYTLTVDLAGGNGSLTGGAYAAGADIHIDAGTRTDYAFAGWTTSNGGSFADASSASTTFTMPAAATTITATWTYTGSTTTPVIPSMPSTPSESEDDGPTTDGSAGWTDIQTELEAAGDGETITVEMNGATEVPAEIFATIAGQDVTLSFEMENGVSWQVNGTDIPVGTSLSDLNLGVAMNTTGISANVINAITGEISTVQITLSHDGDFGFTMTLSAPLGEEHHGYWANLYYFDERAQRLIYQTASLIDATGHAHMRMSHASQYAIVIDDYDHGADLPFTDVSTTDWYYDPVAWAYDTGLMTGTSATTFEPQTPTTRAMIVSMLHRLENAPAAKAASFSDVAADSWYADPVAWAAAEGIVGGYEDNTFQPNKSITREELASILYRYAQYKGLDTSARADLSIYTDAPSPWASEVVSWANAQGLITGRTATTIDAQSTLTRAECAAIFERFLSE